MTFSPGRVATVVPVCCAERSRSPLYILCTLRNLHRESNLYTYTEYRHCAALHITQDLGLHSPQQHHQQHQQQQQHHHLTATMPGYQSCTEVTASCPVEATTYGYYPNLAGNTLFAVIFGLCGLLQLVFGIRYRTYTWMIGVTAGCLLEMAGYIGRIEMHSNPWSSSAFKLQVVALILSPSFIAAGIDLTMKHVALTFGTELSRIKPSLYTWVFIGVDIFAIVVQAAGGGISLAGDTHPDLLKTGDSK